MPKNLRYEFIFGGKKNSLILSIIILSHHTIVCQCWTTLSRLSLAPGRSSMVKVLCNTIRYPTGYFVCSVVLRTVCTQKPDWQWHDFWPVNVWKWATSFFLIKTMCHFYRHLEIVLYMAVCCIVIACKNKDITSGGCGQFEEYHAGRFQGGTCAKGLSIFHTSTNLN